MFYLSLIFRDKKLRSGEEKAPSLSFLLTNDLLDSSRGQKKKKKRKKKTVRNGLASQPPSPIYPSQLALNS